MRAASAVRRVLACLAFAIAVVFALPALAFTPPPNQGPVTDTAGKLSEADKEYLDRRLEALRDRSGY